MKSVIMIPYFFPPEGAAGVYRPLRFVRQLSKMGWDTTVVCADPYRYERYDPELLTLVPTKTEVIRVRACDPWQAIQAWRGKRMETKLSGAPVEVVDHLRAIHRAPLRSWVRGAVRTVEAYYYFPDITKPWIRPAVDATRLACARKNPQAIWATLGPVSSGVVAQKTSQLTGIPYVLDFRDPWELSYYESEITRPKRVTRLAHRNMYKILEQAKSVIFLFPRMAECYWQAYRGALDASKIHIIPNGYEGEVEEFRVSNGGKCTILYTGNLSTYRYDMLLKSLHILKKTEPTLAKQLRLFFIGDGMEKMAREAAALGLSDIVQTAPPTSYAEVMRLQQEAHAFLILGRKPEQRGHELVAGAKLFGYLKARRPILGVLGQDETKRILCNVGVNTIADANSVSEIVRVLRRIHTAWSEDKLSSFLPQREACEKYSAESQTLSLIRVLEGMPPAEPFVPGSVDIPPSLREEIKNGSVWRRAG